MTDACSALGIVEILGEEIFAWRVVVLSKFFIDFFFIQFLFMFLSYFFFI